MLLLDRPVDGIVKRRSARTAENGAPRRPVMESIREFIDNIIGEGVYKIVLSGPASSCAFRKITLNLADGEYFAEKLTEKQAFHERIPLSSAAERILTLFDGFSQINAWDEKSEFTARITKKGKLLSGKHARSQAPAAEGRERKKSYLLSDSRVIPPLVDMGVMTAEGRVKANMYDKFRQINRFLEFIEELIPGSELPEERPLHIIDFGCGKSYLTFIVYYYFTAVKNRRVSMTGIDLKRDVIENCGRLAEKYGYEDLRFHCGDIADYLKTAGGAPVDLVITLHACDTATDFALFNAVSCGAAYILSVPCCQHELNKAADYSALPLFNDGGILRERVSALLTDSIRQKLLTFCGYSARTMEFVDLAHTPKNLLIRAKKAHIPEKNRLCALAEVEETLELIKTEQTLHRLLASAGLLPEKQE